MERMRWNRQSGSGSGSDMNGKQMSEEDENKSIASVSGNDHESDLESEQEEGKSVMEIRVHPFIDTKCDRRVCSLCHKDAATPGCCFIRTADSSMQKAKLKKIRKLYE